MYKCYLHIMPAFYHSYLTDIMRYVSFLVNIIYIYLGSIPGLGRSPGGGHSNPLQYSGLTR